MCPAGSTEPTLTTAMIARGTRKKATSQSTPGSTRMLVAAAPERRATASRGGAVTPSSSAGASAVVTRGSSRLERVPAVGVLREVVGLQVLELDELVEHGLRRVQPRVVLDVVVDLRECRVVGSHVADVVGARGADVAVEVEVDPEVRRDRVGCAGRDDHHVVAPDRTLARDDVLEARLVVGHLDPVAAP